MGIQVIVKVKDILARGGTVTPHIICNGYTDDPDDGSYPVWVPPLMGAVIQFGEEKQYLHNPEDGSGKLWCDAKDPANSIYALLENNNVPYYTV